MNDGRVFSRTLLVASVSLNDITTQVSYSNAFIYKQRVNIVKINDSIQCYPVKIPPLFIGSRLREVTRELS